MYGFTRPSNFTFSGNASPSRMSPGSFSMICLAMIPEPAALPASLSRCCFMANGVPSYILIDSKAPTPRWIAISVRGSAHSATGENFSL